MGRPAVGSRQEHPYGSLEVHGLDLRTSSTPMPVFVRVEHPEEPIWEGHQGRFDIGLAIVVLTLTVCGRAGGGLRLGHWWRRPEPGATDGLSRTPLTALRPADNSDDLDA